PRQSHRDVTPGYGQSALDSGHLHAAEAVEAEDEAVAGRDRQRWDDAAGDHDHAGREWPAILVGKIGDPGEGRERILGAALVVLGAVDGEAAERADRR